MIPMDGLTVRWPTCWRMKFTWGTQHHPSSVQHWSLPGQAENGASQGSVGRAGESPSCQKVSPPPKMREAKRSPRQILRKQYLPEVRTSTKAPLSGGTKGSPAKGQLQNRFCASIWRRLQNLQTPPHFPLTSSSYGIPH